MTNDLDTPIPFTKRHDLLLSGHDRKLDEHGRKLDEHGRKLDEHGRKLDEHGRKLNEHSVDLHRLGILMEENRRDTKLVLDVVLATQKRMDRFDYLDEKVTSHEHRLSAVEDIIRCNRK